MIEKPLYIEELPYRDWIKLRDLIGSVVVSGNESFDAEQLGRWALEALQAQHYKILPPGNE